MASQLLISAIITRRPLNSLVPTNGLSDQLQVPNFLTSLGLRSSRAPWTTPPSETNFCPSIQFRQTFYFQFIHVIVFVDKVAGSPDESRRGRFGFGLLAKFDSPFASPCASSTSNFGWLSLMSSSRKVNVPLEIRRMFFSADPVR